MTGAHTDAVPLPGAAEVAGLVASLQGSSGEFVALLGRYGEPSPALRHLGLILWSRADLPGAVALFSAALGLTPANADLWRDLAGAHAGLGAVDAAEACIRAALRHGPQDARSWLMLAQLRSRAGDHEDAAAAFRRTVALDPACGDAHFGLGLAAYARMDLDAAAASLRAAIATGYGNALGHGALGHVLYAAGLFADSAAAFDAAAAFGPLDPNAARKHARARSFAAIIGGQLDRALADYPALPGADPEGEAALLRDAFAALSGYGYREAAVAVGRLRLARDPGDAAQRYLLDCVSGTPLTRAPADYVERHFDDFAEGFDRKLVDVLFYDVPRRMADLVATTGHTFADTLDLGCGTGLAADPLTPFAGRLTGVDLSGRMLEQAGKRGRYAALVKAEAIAFLDDHPAAYDLVFAADVLIYFGDLAPLFAGVARALRPGGLFAFSIESGEGADYRLQSSGRFAHAPSYVDRLAAPGFSAVVRDEATLRIEAGRPARGQLVVLRRDPDAVRV